MWIVNKYGVAIDTDKVARFRKNGDTLLADMIGLPPTVHTTIIGTVALEDIIANIASGTKVMEVR